MTHDELLKFINDKMAPWDKMFSIANHDDFPDYTRKQAINGMMPWVALYQVVELHKPNLSPYNGKTYCNLNCYEDEGEGERYEEYPCHTIQAIEKALK
jgi:hypothetical protein